LIKDLEQSFTFLPDLWVLVSQRGIDESDEPVEETLLSGESLQGFVKNLRLLLELCKQLEA
jgi:hypothetical protein